MRSLKTLLCLATLNITAYAEKPKAEFPAKHVSVIEKHCLECHDADTEKGKVNLDDLPFQIETIAQAELWQKVLNSVNSGEMPPEDEPQIDKSQKADFLDDLSQTMVLARKSLSDVGGKITMRRLNRREYQNTLQDMLGVKVDINTLPEDANSSSFDTDGASQFISSDQIEQYLSVGRIAIDEAFERFKNKDKKPFVYRLEVEEQVNPALDKSIKNFEEKHEAFQKYLVELNKAADAPENKELLAKIIAEEPRVEKTRWRFLPKHIHKFKGAPDSKTFGLGDANAASFSEVIYTEDYNYHKHIRGLPHSNTGFYMMIGKGINRVDIEPPQGLPVGKYKLRVRGGAVTGSPKFRQFIELGHPRLHPPIKGLTVLAV